MMKTKVMNAGDSFAYRGYYVKRLFLGEYAIQKDGAHIYIALSPEKARAAIDGLLD